MLKSNLLKLFLILSSKQKLIHGFSFVVSAYGTHSIGLNISSFNKDPLILHRLEKNSLSSRIFPARASPSVGSTLWPHSTPPGVVAAVWLNYRHDPTKLGGSGRAQRDGHPQLSSHLFTGCADGNTNIVFGICWIERSHNWFKYSELTSLQSLKEARKQPQIWWVIYQMKIWRNWKKDIQ